LLLGNHVLHVADDFDQGFEMTCGVP